MSEMKVATSFSSFVILQVLALSNRKNNKKHALPKQSTQPPAIQRRSRVLLWFVVCIALHDQIHLSHCGFTPPAAPTLFTSPSGPKWVTEERLKERVQAKDLKVFPSKRRKSGSTWG